jgi:uncharacterized linocin/CFP29 family protein
MNHLLRGHAPISDNAWEAIDAEARSRLEPALAARKLVDFVGPLGWEHSASTLGRVGRLESPTEAVSGMQRRVLPLLELRADFTVSRGEIQNIDRGAKDPDFAELDNAARELAVAENGAVMNGWPKALTGIAEVTPHEKPTLGSDPTRYPSLVSAAVSVLRNSGIAGPYGLALAPEPYRLVAQTAEQGGSLMTEHLSTILEGGPIVWTPGVGGGAVISLRSGDFIFESGQDLSVGYDSHDTETVHLYLQESFSFQVTTPEAAVVFGP